jgi:hypothetical protein
MGVATDFGKIVKLLVNDTTLKTLMNIPTASMDNYGLLCDKYFLQTYISDKFTDDSICRLLIRSAMQNELNEFVKWSGVIIEVYVPKSKDLVASFETKINQICDRLITLLHRVYVNDNKMYFINSYETWSASSYFKRYNCRFQYKKIYK